MGKNRLRKRKGNAPTPGPGPQHGKGPAAPPPQGGFRGPGPVRAMGPPGQRFPGPHCDFRPPNPRMMMMETQGFMMHNEPFHPMGFPGRHAFRPPFDGPDPHFQHQSEFGNRPPAPQFYRPELECGPRFRSPDFCPQEFMGRPPNFNPSGFEGGPGFHNMNPGFDQMEQYGPRDPQFMQQMDVQGNHAFGERGGFAGPPQDCRGPGPVQPPPEVFNATSEPPPGNACPPQPPQNKDQPAPKETNTVPPKSTASKISTLKKISANTPRGCSLGVVSFIGPYCGFIEREDLKKFSFGFDAFHGNRTQLVPGLKVHFTVVKNLGRECAVNVKVAPGGTDDIESAVDEGAVLTTLPESEPPPQPPQNKDQPAPKETKTVPPKSMASKISTFKNIAANTPRGRSLGVVSFIGNSCGFIEREDLKKFSFVFDAFFGNRTQLVPGVKVHFTVVKNLGKECAVDVKVAPGGTDDIESAVYEGVVLTTLPEGNSKDPGCIRTIISTDPIKLPFGKADTDITLLLYDRVEFQLATNLITKEQRATNIKPKTPDTFQLTKEIRELGVVMNKNNGTLTIMTEKHNNLTASAADHLSDDELNVMDEVELTVLTVNDKKKAVRLKKLPEGSVTFNQQAKGNDDKWKPVTMTAGSQESGVDVSSEKYEGTIKVAPKKSPTQEKEQMDKQEPIFGLLVSTVEGTEKRLTFRSGDVISKATMMVGDKVQFNIYTNSLTKDEWAVNVEILPDTFQTDSEEQRRIGLVVKLGDNFGFIKTQQDPQLLFDISEVMEDTKLALSEKVEFTLVPNEVAEGGKRAVRIRRLNESVFTSAPKLEAFGVKEKKKMTIKLLKDPKEQIKQEVKAGGKSSESMDVDKPNKGKDKASPSLSSVKNLKKESEIKQEKSTAKSDRARSRSRENSRRRYSRSRSRESGRRRYSRSRSRSRDRSKSYYSRHRSSSRERREGRYRHKRSHSKERSERYRRSRSRSRSRERGTQSSRKRSRSPADKHDRYTKQSSSKDSSSKIRAKSPDNVDDEIFRKKKELMELNEMIARKKAIVAMEQNTKKIEPEEEADGKTGVTTFDYQHVHRENVWMPELKPVKSILKKQSEPHSDHQSQASASKETSAPLKSESQEMQMGYRQQTSAFGSNTPACSTFESNSERTLTTAWSEKFQDLELVKKKKQLEELSESIARKRAIFALEQKVKVVRDGPEMEGEYEFDSHTEETFLMSKANLWSSEMKPDVQPKKSILKKRSEILSSQSETTSVDEYGQPCQDDSSFTKILPQMTSAPPFNRPSNPQPIHPGAFGLFKHFIESSAASQVIESPPFNELVIPQPLAQASSSRSLHDQKSSNVSKGNNSHDEQQGTTSRQPHDRPHSSNPSTSQTLPSGQKRNLTTQMERFLSALNKADTSVVNSLFQEARRDLSSLNTKKPTQPQLDRNIPFMDEIYDPFKEDEDNDQPSFMVKHSGQERVKNPVKTETHLNDPSKDDLLPHERAVQDGSGFSQLVGMKYGVDPTAKAEKKSPYGHPIVSENWSMHKDPNQFSEQWNPYDEGTDPYATEHGHYTDDHRVYMERSQSVDYQKVNQNVLLSCVEDREMPDSNYDKSLARQQSEESNEEKDRKSENFEKIQSLLQTIGLHLDTAEVSKLADRTQERLYGKMRKSHSASSYSFDQNRERSGSQSEQRGSSRADSSDSEGVRSVSPAHSSNRKVYMSYKDSVKYKDQHKVEDVDLTSIKRTVVNLKPAEDKQDSYESSSKPTAVSQLPFQPVPCLSAVQPDSSQYAQNSNVPTFSASQYPQYQSSDQQFWGVPPGMYPYGTVPPSPNLGYASGLQAVPPHMMATYGSYTAQMANPYGVPPPLSMPYPYGPPPTQNHLHLSSMGASYDNQVVKQIPTQPVRCLKTIETVKTVQTVQTIKAVPSSVLVSIQPTEDNQAKSTSEEAENKQVATITEDDIKAKRKTRLDQFNQRMKLKKEQQMEAQRARGQNRNSATGKISPSEIKNVWICGHSLVFWAEKRATSPEFGVQLGMHPNCVRVWWKGVQGMTWQQLVPLLHQLKDNWPKPDVLIIHLGGNDISTTAPQAFIETVQKDMTSLKSIFPKCLLVWSSILSRQSWRGTEDRKEMHIIRMAINDSIQKMMPELDGSALSHSNIQSHLGHYRPDGVHLSGKGIDIFNLNLQAFLEKWERETNKTETSDPSV